MNLFINFLPVFLFVTLYVGSGVYFLLNNIENAFYQISPTVAIIPALILGWLLNKGTTKDRMNMFLDGVRHRDIIIMCIVFLLAGAFSFVTRSIGSVDATVNMFLSFIPARFLLIGLFIAVAFISTAIGSSMGSIAALGPIVLGLSQKGAFPLDLGIATLIGGATFGDNLSIISDTTIAAVMSQKADFKEKLKINSIVALISSVITILILLYSYNQEVLINPKEYSIILVFPYILLITLASLGVNVFAVLICSLFTAGIIGYFFSNFSIISFCQNISQGFSSMYDIMLLSMLVGGLSGMVSNGIKTLSNKLSLLAHRGIGKKTAQLLIGAIVSVFDILLANNTVAIIFSGKIAEEIAREYKIPAHYSAAWLDIFSCVFQGIIPYGAQVLLAGAITGVSPLNIITKVYYCYVLAIVSIFYILIKNDCDVNINMDKTISLK